MGEGQDVLRGTFDLPAANAADDRLAALEADRGRVHAGELRVVLEHWRLHKAAGLELSAVPHVALVLSCSEHRAHELLTDAQVLDPLPGALEALEVGLLTVEQSRRLVDAVAPLPFEQRCEVWLRLQARLLDRESPLPPERVRELLRGWVIQADPAAATERRKLGEADGRVDYRRRSDSLTDILLLGLNGPDAQAVLQNIRRHADPMPGGDPRSADKRLLDAAKDLLLGRTGLPFDEQRCQPGCDCRPGQPAPCGADVTVFVPQGAALRTTDELAFLVGHGPIEPDLLAEILAAAPLLRAVFVDEHGVPVADSPLVLRPPRNDPAALREALLKLANSPPGPHQPRHPGDHQPPVRPGMPGGGAPTPPLDPAPAEPDPPGATAGARVPPDAASPDTGPPDAALPDDRPPDAALPDDRPPDDEQLDAALPQPARPRPVSSDLTLLRQLARQVIDRRRAAADAARPQLLEHPHPAGAPGAYAPSRRVRRFLRARRPRCEWPGCGARASRCDLDHDLAHPHGPTCPCNIGPLCRRHHRVKQNDWTKQRARDNSVRWTSPSGRTWTSPTPHQPPQQPIRPLPPLPEPLSELDQLSPLALDEALWQLDPASPLWDDPAAHELRAVDLDPHQVDQDPGRDTTWGTDLDDPYDWHDLPHPADA